MNVCPLCESNTVPKERVKPRLTAEGTMVQIPFKYIHCANCGLEYCGKEELDFNATQAHLSLNQFSSLDTDNAKPE